MAQIFLYSDFSQTYSQSTQTLQSVFRSSLARIRCQLAPVGQNIHYQFPDIRNQPNGSATATFTIRDAATNAVLATATISMTATRNTDNTVTVNSWSVETTPGAPVINAIGSYPPLFHSQSAFGPDYAFGRGLTLEVGAGTLSTAFGSPAQWGIATTEELTGTVATGWSLTVGLVEMGKPTVNVSRPNNASGTDANAVYDSGRFSASGSTYQVFPVGASYADPASAIQTFTWQFDQGVPYDLSVDATIARVIYPGANKVNGSGTIIPYTGGLTVVAANGAWNRTVFSYSYSHAGGQLHRLHSGKTVRATHSLNTTTFANAAGTITTLVRERYPKLGSREALGVLLTQDAVTGLWKLRSSVDFFKTFDASIVTMWDETFKNADWTFLSSGGAGTIALKVDTSPAQIWFKRSPDALVWDDATALSRGFELKPAVQVATTASLNHFFTIEQETVNGSTRLRISNGTVSTSSVRTQWISDDLGDNWTPV